MNSTSAGDRGGRIARVDDGRVLLGAPGAPGCTTTGLVGLVCCARAAEENKSAERLATTSNACTTTRAQPGLGFSVCLRRGDIFIWTKLKSCHEIGNFERGKRERQTGQRVGFLQECRSRGVSAANPTILSGWWAILKSSGRGPKRISTEKSARDSAS
ncbi:MAG: hypothetical protein QOF56_3949 [Acidobacteriaceae bacterium]|nr:hypothetical protein [Acidobacteriaceae bacterium]